MKNKEYNGWYNYNVWNVMLYVDNEAEIYNYWYDTMNSYYQKKISFKQFMKRLNRVGAMAHKVSDVRKEKLTKKEISEIRSGLRRQYKDLSEYSERIGSKKI